MQFTEQVCHARSECEYGLVDYLTPILYLRQAVVILPYRIRIAQYGHLRIPLQMSNDPRFNPLRI
jgi:hypothetical protein